MKKKPPPPTPVWYSSWYQPEKAPGSAILGLFATLLTVLVVGGTFLYALAFTAIYRQPHSRIQASRWIYETIPTGAVLANEHWDDSLPLRIDGKDGYGGMYEGVTMNNYDMDSQEKLNTMIVNLIRSDYIILSSNRLYDSIPRLPSRFPMTIRYYDYLFAEELGFRQVAVFTSYPHLFGFELPDQSADESFSVYDHPKVTIFEKTDDFDPERARLLLGAGIDWQNISYILPKDAAKLDHKLILSPTDRYRYEQAGTWSNMFSRDSLMNQYPVVAWALALLLLSVLTFPITFVVCRNLADRGYGFSRVLGLLLVSWIVWILASTHLLPTGRTTIVQVMGGVALVSLIILVVQWQHIGTFLKTRGRVLLFQEGLFWLLFLLFVLIRWKNPDLWHPARGGEKPMDFAYLNAVIKSAYFPPYDPWFAGGSINYYYFGFVLVATLIQLTGVEPSVAYNLAVPMLFAMTGAGAFCVVFNLVEGWHDPWWVHPSRHGTSHTLSSWIPFFRSASGNGAGKPAEGKGSPAANRSKNLLFGVQNALRVGVVAVFFVAIIGNLGEARLILDGLKKLSTLEQPPDVPVVRDVAQAADGLHQLLTTDRSLDFQPEWWYWNATRVIPHPLDEPGPINEFPFFTFLYADLHAHMMALPCTLLVLVLLVNLLRSESAVPTNGGLGGTTPLLRSHLRERTTVGDTMQQTTPPLHQEIPLLLALALSIGALWPTNTWDFPTYAVLFGAALLCREYAHRWTVDVEMIWQACWRWVLVVAVGYGMFYPFHANSVNAYTGAEWWKGSRTPLDAYLTMHGFFLFLITSYLLVELMQGSGHNAAVQGIRRFIRRWVLFQRKNQDEEQIEPTLWSSLLFSVALVAVVLVLLLAFIGKGVFALVLLLLTLTGMLLASAAPDPRRQFVLCLTGLGLLLTAMVEVVVLTGDIGRMNTVFKFSMQVWVMWGVACAAVLPMIAARLRQPSGAFRRALASLWWVVLVLLTLACLLYPIFATPSRIKDRAVDIASTLDGSAYMQFASYADDGREVALDWDYEAIVWMQEHVQGSPAIVEAQTPLYRWGSRVSIYTGLPTLMGWDWHQRQQRALMPSIILDQREQAVQVIYDSPDPDESLSLLHEYGVQYIYVGPLERIYYQDDGLKKFFQYNGTYWNLVYDNPDVQIYEVGQTR